MRKITLKKDYIFWFFFECKKDINYRYITKVLFIFNKYFGEFKVIYESTITNDSDLFLDFIDWKELFLNNYKLCPDENLKNSNYEWDVDLNCKVTLFTKNFFTNKNELKLIEKVKITWGKSLGCKNSFFMLSFYTDVFTDKNYDEEWNIEKQKWDIRVLDESEAARKNRKILHDFIKEVEEKLDIENIEVESEVLDEKYIYKYGIKENAVIRGYENL